MAVTARADSSAEAASGASASTTSSDGRNRWPARPADRAAAVAASAARDSTPIRRPAITSSPSPASLARAASRAGVACAVKISRSTGSVSAADRGGQASSSASFSRSAAGSSTTGTPPAARLAADHDHAGAAGELLACLVRGRRDEQGVLPVQRRKAVPGHRSGHPDRSGPGVRGDRVQQGPHRRRLARIPRACVDRVAGPGPGQPDRVEPGQLHAEPVVGHRVAAGGDPVETGCQVRRDVPDEDHRLAQRPGRRDQPPEPPAAVGRGRITRVGPGRAGQHGRRFDEHQVGARALQHHVRVVRQQREHGRVRGERGAGPRGQHPGDDQARRSPAGCLGARRAETGRGQRGQEAFPAAGQVAELRGRQRQRGRSGPGQAAALPPQPDQVRGQLDAARPGPPRGPDQGPAEFHRRGLLERGQPRLRHGQLQPGLAQRPGQPVPFRGQPGVRRPRCLLLAPLD